MSMEGRYIITDFSLKKLIADNKLWNLADTNSIYCTTAIKSLAWCLEASTSTKNLWTEWSSLASHQPSAPLKLKLVSIT